MQQFHCICYKKGLITETCLDIGSISVNICHKSRLVQLFFSQPVYFLSIGVETLVGAPAVLVVLVTKV